MKLYKNRLLIKQGDCKTLLIMPCPLCLAIYHAPPAAVPCLLSALLYPQPRPVIHHVLAVLSALPCPQLYTPCPAGA